MEEIFQSDRLSGIQKLLVVTDSAICTAEVSLVIRNSAPLITSINSLMLVFPTRENHFTSSLLVVIFLERLISECPPQITGIKLYFLQINFEISIKFCGFQFLRESEEPAKITKYQNLSFILEKILILNLNISGVTLIFKYIR